MVKALSVVDVFRRSAPHVERLSLKCGPFRDSEPAKIDDVCRTIWERKGKRLRPHLVYWFGEWCGVPAEDLDLYAWAAEAIHTATLLHDDVIDQAHLRRGGPSANHVYDNTLPVLSGDYLISDVIHQVALRGHPQLLLALSETLKDLCSGEVAQYELKYSVVDDPKEYDRITALKTTSLFGWCAIVGPVLSGGERRVLAEEYTEIFGRLFQLSDDLLDVVGTGTKDRWADLREGKLNGVTWWMTGQDENLRDLVCESFARREVTEGLIRAFERSPSLCRAVSRTNERLHEMASQADSVLERFDEGVLRRALHQLAHLCIDRCS